MRAISLHFESPSYILNEIKKKYLINSNEEKVEITFFQTRKGSMLAVSGQIWPEIELIQA